MRLRRVSAEGEPHSRLEMVTTWMYRPPEVAELRAIVEVGARMLDIKANVDDGYLMSWRYKGKAGQSRLLERMSGCGLVLLDHGFSGEYYRVCGVGHIKSAPAVVEVSIDEDRKELYAKICSKKYKLCRRALKKCISTPNARVFTPSKVLPKNLMNISKHFDGYFRPSQDMYGLGHIIHELLTGTHVLESSEELDSDAELSFIFRRRASTFTAKETYCDMIKVFFHTALAKDPRQRLSAHEAFRILAL